MIVALKHRLLARIGVRGRFGRRHIANGDIVHPLGKTRVGL